MSVFNKWSDCSNNDRLYAPCGLQTLVQLVNIGPKLQDQQHSRLRDWVGGVNAVFRKFSKYILTMLLMDVINLFTLDDRQFDNDGTFSKEKQSKQNYMVIESEESWTILWQISATRRCGLGSRSQGPTLLTVSVWWLLTSDVNRIQSDTIL